jgi:hypothetical protein
MKKIQIEKPEKQMKFKSQNVSVSAMASESRLPTQCPYRQALLYSKLSYQTNADSISPRRRMSVSISMKMVKVQDL